MATRSTDSGFNIAGIGVGGLLVSAGLLIAIFGSVFWGLVLAVVGLVFFGGFAKGRWC